MDCGEIRPWVLTFDHRDPALKKYGIAKMVSDGFSVESIAKEIAKCDVRCMNCHADRHHREKQRR